MVMTMINEATIRQFWKRLNHRLYGLTELVAILKGRGGIIATGFFDNEDAFVSTCRAYNGQCNIYAGRNPRPAGITKIRNFMDTVEKRRARDRDIEYLTAISLDIDPIRRKGLSSTGKQHYTAIRFGLDLQWDLGGDVDSSGNGVYLWVPFKTPIRVISQNFDRLKRQCAVWQAMLNKKYHPEKYGLKIDGCFDFSRLKRVIGTFNHKAQRLSKFVRQERASDQIRNTILGIDVGQFKSTPAKKIRLPPLKSGLALPQKFEALLKWDLATRKLWENPDPFSDSSRNDWLLGLSCVEAGIGRPEELAAILMNNPHGKYQRDRREGYVRGTVGKLVPK